MEYNNSNSLAATIGGEDQSDVVFYYHILVYLTQSLSSFLIYPFQFIAFSQNIHYSGDAFQATIVKFQVTCAIRNQPCNLVQQNTFWQAPEDSITWKVNQPCSNIHSNLNFFLDGRWRGAS
jgi:hypothetical protein